jgi:predicted AAA+ superfamily ATPase
MDAQGSVLPIEVKMREKIKTKDLKLLIKFMKRFQCSKGLIVSKNEERIERIENFTVAILPYWRYWSIMNETEAISPRYQ